MQNYTLTPTIVRALITIEAARQAVTMTTLPLLVVEQVVFQSRRISGRELDVREVRNYYRTLQKIETWAEQQTSIAEDLIHRLQTLILKT